MSHHQVLFADLVEKTINHWFVPADGKAVTIVLEEGRISLGAPSVRAADSSDLAGAKILSTRTAPVSDTATALTITTDKGILVVTFEGAPALVELPE